MSARPAIVGRAHDTDTVRVEIAQPRAVTLTVAADILAVSSKTLRRMVERNEIPTLRIGARVLVPLAQLDAWIAEHHTPAAS